MSTQLFDLFIELIKAISALKLSYFIVACLAVLCLFGLVSNRL